MQTPDLSPLIKGIFVIVGIAISLGQYGRLEHWARKQAMEAVAWREPLPYFFAQSKATAHHALKAPATAHARHRTNE